MMWVLATRKTPAVTMVAAWMRADTGVGPAMASGSQTYSGNWALLPVQARNSSRAMAVTVPAASAPASPKTTSKSRLPVVAKIRNMASRKPTSPMRLARKAFLAAGGAHTSWVSSGSPSTRRPSGLTTSSRRLNQNPTSRYEQSPTPSQPRNMTRKFWASTSTSIEATNRLSQEKKVSRRSSCSM